MTAIFILTAVRTSNPTYLERCMQVATTEIEDHIERLLKKKQ
jgi:hypothetical protein